VPVTTPHFQKRARHSPHHSAKKGRADHVHPHFISGLAYLEGEEFAPRVFHVVFEFFGVRSEIVLPNQSFRC